MTINRTDRGERHGFMRDVLSIRSRCARAEPRCQAGANNLPPPPPARVQFDGHYYQVVFGNKISWEAAKVASSATQLAGRARSPRNDRLGRRRCCSSTSCANRFSQAGVLRQR